MVGYQHQCWLTALRKVSTLGVADRLARFPIHRLKEDDAARKKLSQSPHQNGSASVKLLIRPTIRHFRGSKGIEHNVNLSDTNAMSLVIVVIQFRLAGWIVRTDGAMSAQE